MARARPIFTLQSRSPGHTGRIGRALGRSLKRGVVLSLDGDLGSGKTVFVRGLAQGLGIAAPQEVRSPTFAIIQEHQGRRIPLCHVDLYRLERPEIEGLGLEEYWHSNAERPEGWVVAVEWAQKGGGYVPAKGANTLKIRFDQRGKSTRILNFFGNKQWERNLKTLKF